MSEHKKKLIVVHGERVEVDEELGLLISELNRLGLKTANCCQGGTEAVPFAYVSVCLDDGYFCYDPATKTLTFRWNRTDQKFVPTSPFIHTKSGGILRIEDLLREHEADLGLSSCEPEIAIEDVLEEHEGKS